VCSSGRSTVFTLFLLFFRFLPVIAISEVKGVTPEAHAGKKH